MLLLGVGAFLLLQTSPADAKTEPQIPPASTTPVATGVADVVSAVATTVAAIAGLFSTAKP